METAKFGGNSSIAIVVNPGERIILPPCKILIPQLPPQPPPPPPPPIIGHCIFCLRQLIELPLNINQGNKTKWDDHELRIVPKADVPQTLVTTFNKVLPCLHKKWRTMEKDPKNPSLRNLIRKRKRSYYYEESIEEGSSLPKEFPRLPAMCLFCGKKFQNLHRMIFRTNLWIRELGKVIKDSKNMGTYSWRWEQFEKDLRNNQTLTEKTVKSTLEFYEGLGLFESDDDDDDNDDNQEGDSQPDIKQESDKNECWNDTDDVSVKVEGDYYNSDNDNDNGCNYDGMNEPTQTAPPIPTEKPITGPSTTSSELSQKRKCPRKTEVGKKIIRRIYIRKKPRPPRRPKPAKLKIKCEFCPRAILITKVKEHLQEHIQDYVCPCPNPACARAFASPAKLEANHLVVSSKCRKVVKPSCKCEKRRAGGNISRCTCKWEKVCESCDFKTNSQMELKFHLKKCHENPTEKNFFCPIDGCGEGFTVRQSVQCHLDGWSHNFSIKSAQKCPECGISVKLEEMGTHLQTEHQAEQVISCKECQFSFPSWETLLGHLATHRKDPECLTCYICNDGVKYAFIKTLEYHFYTEHKIGQLLCCDQCEKSFFSNFSLSMHIKMTHLKYRPLTISKPKSGGTTPKKLYACEVEGCGMVYGKWSSFRAHKLVKHSSGIAHGYKCAVEECGKMFTSWAVLEEHRVSVHLGIVKEKEKPICEECGESFSDSGALRTHQMIHTGERPFQCSYCGQRFRHTGSLKTHMESHESRGDGFKPNGPMKNVRKRVRRN